MGLKKKFKDRQSGATLPLTKVVMLCPRVKFDCLSVANREEGRVSLF
jgi:hypothetical protein